MARKLKSFITTGGFFELAVAAPSMKAAAELLGIKPNAFAQGFAHETKDASIIGTTMAQPGVVLRRAVGTKGKFVESAELPKLSALQAAMNTKRAAAPQRMPAAKTQKTTKPMKVDTASGRKAAELYDLAEKRREREELRAEAERAKEQDRRERLTEKAKAALDEARSRHHERKAEIDKQREALDKKAGLEDERWDEEEEKLKAALRRAEDE